MIIKTVVPKLGDSIHYIGKPVKNESGKRIGGIIDVVDIGDHYEISMDISFEFYIIGWDKNE